MEEKFLGPTRDNYILERFLTEIPMPKPEAMDQFNQNKRPRLGSPDQAADYDEEPVLRLPKSPTTPKTVSFPSTLPPESPGSARSARSIKSIAYKDGGFVTELEVRGVVMTNSERPSDWEKITKMIQKPSKGLRSLDKEAIETLNECLAMPSNEATIQAVVVGILLDIHQIFRSQLTYAIFQGQFSSESILPTLPGTKEGSLKLAPPWPDLTIGLRRSHFQDYIVVLHNLGALVSPIPSARGLIFPFFTLEVKGEGGQLEAETQNKNNVAHMLRNLRSLSCRARGEQVTFQVFDETVRSFTVTVNRTMVTIWGHWTRAKSGHTYIHSACLKSTSIQGIDNADWQSLHLELHNTISYVMETTNNQVSADLAAIEARK